MTTLSLKFDQRRVEEIENQKVSEKKNWTKFARNKEDAINP